MDLSLADFDLVIQPSEAVSIIGALVVVAAQSISASTVISPEMLKVVEKPKAQVITGVFTDTAPLVGKMTAVAIAPDEQFSSAKLGPPLSTGQPIGPTYRGPASVTTPH